MTMGLKAFVTLLVAGTSFAAFPHDSTVTVRQAPYVVSSVSSKTERGRATCKYCSATMLYDRTYKWDVYNHVWKETTAAEKVPQVCRKCQRAEKEQEKLDKKERELDRKISYEESKNRIETKKNRLRRLRNANR